MILASIPSPSDAVWEIGPFPLRAYALCIILGVVVAIWLGERRWVARGGKSGTVSDMAIWAIPFGLVGARVYHVCTNPELYFAGDGRPIEALYIWQGGLGIWGAIALGGVGAYIAARRAGASFAALADTLAPGILFAQAIGRWGNWFNQELFGKPTDKPWGLEIAPENRPLEYANEDTFQPTFLYESIWALIGGLVLLWVARRFRIGYGRVFALYVMIYTAGRGWIETLRVDDAHEFGGLRLNVWTSIVVFCCALAYFIWMGRRHPGRQEVVQTPRGDAAGDTADDDAGTDGAESADDDASGAKADGVSKDADARGEKDSTDEADESSDTVENTGSGDDRPSTTTADESPDEQSEPGRDPDGSKA